MSEYEIWTEGYSCTGQTGEAQLICISEGENFKDACNKAYALNKFEGYGNYDPECLTIWGCKLFDSQMAARRSFG